MNHLEWHQHAFLDNNNIVINVAVFDESAHDHQLLEDIKSSLNATSVVCCCTHGLGNIGDTWNGSIFIPPSPYPSWIWSDSSRQWQAPVPMPEDDTYIWDEVSKTWVVFTSSAEGELVE